MMWNKFVKEYPDAVALMAAVSDSLQISFDAKKQKLPTPYGLFLEWFGKHATGDWTSMKVKGGFVIRAASQSDGRLIVGKYRAVTGIKKTEVADRTAQISYRDSSYASLAEELGYALPGKRRP